MPKTKKSLRRISSLAFICEIRNQKVILAADLASIYRVETRTLNQAVKRNPHKFPEDFMFQLTEEEMNTISRSQNVILKRGKNIKYLPYAFTEHGAVMAANILNSAQAVTMSVYVVRAFVKLKQMAIANEDFAQKLKELENKLTARQDLHEKAILKLISQMRALLTPSNPQSGAKKQIGFRN